VAVASLGVIGGIGGGMASGAMDFVGFRACAVVSGVLFAAAGVCSALGISSVPGRTLGSA
jgi:hypothetical protein